MTAVDFGKMEGSKKRAPPRCNFFCENGQNRPCRLLDFPEASWVLPETPKHYACRAWSAWRLQDITPVEWGAPGGSRTLCLSNKGRLEALKHYACRENEEHEARRAPQAQGLRFRVTSIRLTSKERERSRLRRAAYVRPSLTWAFP